MCITSDLFTDAIVGFNLAVGITLQNELKSNAIGQRHVDMAHNFGYLSITSNEKGLFASGKYEFQKAVFRKNNMQFQFTVRPVPSRSENE